MNNVHWAVSLVMGCLTFFITAMTAVSVLSKAARTFFTDPVAQAQMQARLQEGDRRMGEMDSLLKELRSLVIDLDKSVAVFAHNIRALTDRLDKFENMDERG